MADTRVAELIARLGAARQALVDEVSRIEVDDLDSRARPGEWDLAQILRHMVYAERRYVTSVAAIRVALNLGPVADPDLTALLDEWRFSRETLLHELSHVKSDQLDERVPASDRTIREWVEMAVNHDLAHSAQLGEILGNKGK